MRASARAHVRETALHQASRRERRGFTLIETVLALFLLVGVFTIIINLFHGTLRYGARIEVPVFASVIASRKVEEIRAWAMRRNAANSGYNFDGSWSAYSGVTKTDAENPAYQVRTDVTDVALVSPCSTPLDSPSSTDGRRLTAKKVRVTVSSQVGGAASSVTLYALIRQPPRTFRASNPIVVTCSQPGSLGPEGTADLSVQAFDGDGKEMRNLCYEWYVSPIDGRLTISAQSQDGSRATVINHVHRPDGSIAYTGGQCQVRARAVCKGVEAWGTCTLTLLR